MKMKNACCCNNTLPPLWRIPMELLHYTDEARMDPARRYAPMPASRFWKPEGLWVSHGDAWKVWCLDNDMDRDVHAAPWRVHVARPEQVCVLRSVAEFDAFCLRYGFVEDRLRSWALRRRPVDPVHLLALDETFPGALLAPGTGIEGLCRDIDAHHTWRMDRIEATGREFPFEMDWPAVQKRYAGLVVAPYLHERRHVRWYYGWDVASGVLWDLPRAGVSFARVVATTPM